jgi:glycosyltransferase involved in cell wall biosynthesis
VSKLVLSGLTLAHPHVGQGVYSLRLIAALLQEFGRNLTILAPATVERPSSIPLENFRTLPPTWVPRAEIIRTAIWSNRLLDYVAREWPDAIFHSPGPIWGRTKPSRTVVTVHDCIYRHFSNYNGRLFLRRGLMQLTERFAARASLVLTDSEFSRRDLITKTAIPSGKIEVLYPWVGREFLEPVLPEAVSAVRASLELPENFWLYLGGYDFRKNVDFLLHAYADASRQTDLPPLVLAGMIPSRRGRSVCDVTGAMNRLRLTGKQVILSGPVEARDLPALYRAASLLVYPSLLEGFGLPPAEAIAVGTPVLSSDAGSLREVVSNEDALFDPRDRNVLIQKFLAAVGEERKFVSQLSPMFTEAFGVARYVDFVEKVTS